MDAEGLAMIGALVQQQNLSELVSKRSVQLRSHKQYVAKTNFLPLPSLSSHTQNAAMPTLVSPLNQRPHPVN